MSSPDTTSRAAGSQAGAWVNVRDRGRGSSLCYERGARASNRHDPGCQATRFSANDVGVSSRTVAPAASGHHTDPSTGGRSTEQVQPVRRGTVHHGQFPFDRAGSCSISTGEGRGSEPFQEGATHRVHFARGGIPVDEPRWQNIARRSSRQRRRQSAAFAVAFRIDRYPRGKTFFCGHRN